MKFSAIFLLLLAICTLPTTAFSAKNPQVRIQTSLGEITLELDAKKAPKSVDNFLNYVKMGFYDGTIFHRVISNFMVQGGGYTRTFEQKKTNDPVENEADNGLPNVRGSIAMARTPNPHSATAQFFINVVDNDFLNHRNKSPQGWGYAVFGKVVSGMDVVDKIRKTPTGSGGPFRSDVPQITVVIEKAEIIK